jgi:fibronectin-binding autotransporter adhesin
MHPQRKGRPSQTTTDLRQRPLIFAIASCFATGVSALPVDPTVVAGSAVFHQAGAVLNVTNSNGAIINWQQFNIGAGETTRFIQPTASSAVLNRVLAADPSLLYGTLASNGKVFLVNPAGILVGAGARIDTAGFVASTLAIKDSDFLAGKLSFGQIGAAANGLVSNQGTITTVDGGSVYLIGANVSNQGIIHTPGGEAILAAGQTVQLVDTATPGVKVEITGDGTTTNLGSILADAGRIGLTGAIVRNSGTLNASSLVKEGGKVFLRATKRIELTPESRIAADGTRGGTVIAKVESENRLAGALVAEGSITATGQPGQGGFIETSASSVDIRDGFTPSTGGGNWLIDPIDFTISAGSASQTVSGIGATTLQTALASTPVTIQTDGTTLGNGDIFVNSGVSWSSANSLTLQAHRDINVNASLTASGTGTITLEADSSALSPDGIGKIQQGSSGNIISQAAGTVTLRAGNGIKATINGTSNVLDAQSTTGNVELEHSSGTLAINSALALDSLTLSGGTLTGSGNITLNSSGSFTWTNGVLSGSGTLTTPATVTTSLTPGFAQTAALRGSRVWDNYGTVTFTPNSGTLSFFQIDDSTGDGTAVFNNKSTGLFNINASYTDTHIIGVGTFNNAGELRKSLNTSVATSGFAPTFNNQSGGIVNVNSGALRFDAGGTDAGNYALANSATLQFNGGPRSISGNIGGTGNVTFSKPQTATAVYTLTGDYNISGTTAVALDNLGTGTLAFNGTVTNFGTAYTESGTVSSVSFTGMTSGETTGFANLASINITSGSTTFKNGTVFTALTSLSKAGNQMLDMGDAAINLNSLTLSGGTLTGDNTITLGAAASFNWTGGTISGTGALVTPATVPFTLSSGSITLARDWNSAGSLSISGGALTANGVLSAATLNMSGGTLQGSGNVPISGAFNWSAGTITGSGNLDTSGTTTLNPSSSVTLAGTRTWNNSGTVNQSGAGYLYLASGTPTVNNLAGAVWNEASTNTSQVLYYGTFNNAGTFNKSGSNTAVITNTVFNNSASGSDGVQVTGGTLRLSTGTSTDSGKYALSAGTILEFNGGTRDLNSGTNISGAGNLLFSGGTVNANTGAVITALSDVTLTGGTFVQNTGSTFAVTDLTMTGGVLQGTGDVSVSGVFDWSAGTITGSGTLNTAGTTTLNPSSSVTLAGTRTWNNSGTVNQSGAGYLYMASGTPTVNNLAGAVWNEASTNTSQVLYYGTFNNAGTFNKSGGTTAVIYNTAFNNSASGSDKVNVATGILQLNTATSNDSGSYDIASGAQLVVIGGTRNWDSGTTFSGSGNLIHSGGTINVNAATSIPASLSYTMTGGTLQGSGNFSLAGAFDWSAGTITGSGTLNTAGTTTLNPSSSVTLAGTRTWNNSGTVNQSGAGYLYMASGTPTVNNLAGAVWNEASTNTSQVLYYGTFNNAGTFNKSGGTTAVIYNTAFNNSASGSDKVNVATGILQLNTATSNDSGSYDIASGAQLVVIGGTRNWDSGTTFSGSGNLIHSGGTINVNAATSIPASLSYTMTGGTLQGSGNFSLAGAFDWSAGTITGSGTLNTAGTTTLNPSSSVTLAGTRTWNNSGTVNQSGAGYLYMASGTPTVNNLAGAVWNEASTNTSQVLYYGTFNNAGTFNKSGGTTATLYNTSVSNSTGTINIDAGTLALTTVLSNAGTILVDSGATLSTSGTGLTNVAGGTIGGSGAINLGSATLTNNGKLVPGGNNATGTLSISGNLTTGGTGSVELEAGSSVAHDTLAISGSATLTGTLKLSTINGYLPVPSDSFNGLTATSFSGDFTTKDLPSQVTASPSGTNYVLTFTSSCLGVCWDAGGLADTSWLNPANWTSDTLPSSLDIVYVALSGSNTVTLSSGSVSIKGLNVTGNNTLAFSGGSLTLNDSGTASVINGTFNMSGGTLAGPGTLTVNGAMNWSAGTMSGTGSTTIASGKTLNITGGVTINGGYILANAGTTTWTGTGNINLQNGGLINNSGLFVAQNNQVFTSAGGGASIVNSGTFQKTTGTGNTDFNVPLTSNGGIFTADTGVFRYNSTNTFNTGTTFNGAAANRILSGASLSGTINSTNLELAGGNYSGSAYLTTGNTVNWTGGSFTGAGTFNINSGAVLNITGTGQVTVDGGYNLINAGTLNWLSSNNINVQNAGVINNSGLFSAQTNQTVTSAGGGASLINAGSFVKSIGTGNTDINIPLTSNGGTFTANSGVLRYNSSNAFNTGTTFNGATVNRVTSGAVMSGVLTSGNLELAGGNYTGTFNLPAASAINWTGGSFTGSGTFTVSSGAALNVTGGSQVTIDGGFTLANTGTLNWSSTNNINVQNAGVINNSGLFSAQNDQTVTSAGGGASFINSGVISKSVGAGNTDIGIPLTSNGGTFTANTGVLRYTSSNSFNTGTIFNGTAGNRIVNGAAFSGAINTSNLELAGGSYTGTFNLPAANSLNWTGGTFTGGGTFTVNNGAVFNITGANQLTIDGGFTLANIGTTNWLSSNNINLQNGGGFNNSGLFSAQTNQTLTSAGGGASFINTGSFVKSVGTGNTDIGIPLTSNGGTFTANSGVLRYTGGSKAFNTGSIFNGATDNQITGGATFSGTLSSGNLELAGGSYTGTANLASGSTLKWSGGSFTGAGTFNINSGAVFNIIGANQVTVDGGFTLVNAGTLNWLSSSNINLQNAGVISNSGLFSAQTNQTLTSAGGGASFVNSGSFVKSVGTGSTAINIPFDNQSSGAINVQTGDSASKQQLHTERFDRRRPRYLFHQIRRLHQQRHHHGFRHGQCRCGQPAGQCGNNRSGRVGNGRYPEYHRQFQQQRLPVDRPGWRDGRHPI